MNIKKICEGLGLSEDKRIKITKVSNGYNIRICNAKFKKKENTICVKCGKYEMCEEHHIIFRSANGDCDMDNIMNLCHKCHMDLHDRKWKIDSIIDPIKIQLLKLRYKV